MSAAINNQAVAPHGQIVDTACGALGAFGRSPDIPISFSLPPASLSSKELGFCEVKFRKMRFWSLLVVAWMPVLQVLLAGLLGACLASSRLNVLTADARRSMNKIVYIVFVPSLVFSSLAGAVTIKDIISWFGSHTLSDP